MLFPEDGLVYDYCLDDGGISKIGTDDDEVETTSSGEVKHYFMFIVTSRNISRMLESSMITFALFLLAT